jgi:hypothetical protein
MAKRIPRRFACLAALGAVISAGLALSAGPAAAVTVSTEAELQTAFANAAETEIVLANSIDLTCGGGGDLDRNSATNLTIEGNGFTIRQTCAGERVMEQAGNGTITLNNVTITGGTAGSSGGGIAVDETVTINNSRVTGNTATTGNAGGVGANDVFVNNSTISDNTAPSGGGIGAATATVTNSTFTGNHATDSDGGAIGAGTATATASTFAGNSAGDNGGAIGVDSGSIFFTNSTATNNTAGGDGGGGLAGGTVTLRYATVVQNTNGIAANVLAFSDGLNSFGSVVALPQGGPNCSLGGSNSNGFNFSDDATCEFTGAADTESGGDPGLGALASNGGPTETRLPSPGSPLIDAIPIASCNFDGITTDQRGISRPQGTGCDIGAVEVQPATPSGPSAAAPVTAEPRFTG